MFAPAEDEPFEQLLAHCQSFGALCLQKVEPCGPFNAPTAAFVDDLLQVQGWLPVNEYEGATYAELIEIVRREAVSRSSRGRIAGAALMVRLLGPGGESALGVQFHTRRTAVMLVFPVNTEGTALGPPQESSLLIPDGLCEFPARVSN